MKSTVIQIIRLVNTNSSYEYLCLKFFLPLSPYLNNQCNVKMSLNARWCVITVLVVKLFKFEAIKVEKNEKVCTWAHFRLFYRVMTVERCAEVGAPGLPDLVTSHSTARLSEVVQGRRPHVPRPLLDLPHHFPSLGLRIRSRHGHYTPGLADICFMGH